MKNICLATAVSLLAACHSTNKTTMNASDEHAAGGNGWTALFDGKTTKGWHTYNKQGVGKAWKAEDGVLHFDPKEKQADKAAGGDIVTDDEFENFHLKYEWKISPRGNSGVMFYVHEDAGIPAPYHTGPEMQVLDNGSPTVPGHPDAKLYTHRAGDLYDLLAAKEATKPPGEWNAAEIVCNNGKLEFFMNGQRTLSTILWDDNWRKMIAVSKFKQWSGFGTHKKGRIALQDHGDEVWFRNIKINKL